jgi:hypothetical protein
MGKGAFLPGMHSMVFFGSLGLWGILVPLFSDFSVFFGIFLRAFARHSGGSMAWRASLKVQRMESVVADVFFENRVYLRK